MSFYSTASQVIERAAQHRETASEKRLFNPSLQKAQAAKENLSALVLQERQNKKDKGRIKVDVTVWVVSSIEPGAPMKQVCYMSGALFIEYD